MRERKIVFENLCGKVEGQIREISTLTYLWMTLGMSHKNHAVLFTLVIF